MIVDLFKHILGEKNENLKIAENIFSNLNEWRSGANVKFALTTSYRTPFEYILENEFEITSPEEFKKNPQLQEEYFSPFTTRVYDLPFSWRNTGSYVLTPDKVKKWVNGYYDLKHRNKKFDDVLKKLVNNSPEWETGLVEGLKDLFQPTDFEERTDWTGQISAFAGGQL